MEWNITGEDSILIVPERSYCKVIVTASVHISKKLFRMTKARLVNTVVQPTSARRTIKHARLLFSTTILAAEFSDIRTAWIVML